MGQFVVGDVVVVSFPFSNLKRQKIRPALVLAQAEFSNVILCQITSKPYSSTIAVSITDQNFAVGRLPVASYIRPDKLFTADPSIIRNKVGALKVKTRRTAVQAVRQLFSE